MAANETRPGYEGTKPAAFRYTMQRPVTDPSYGEISEITVREPTGADITRIGDPVRYVPGGQMQDVSFDELKMTLMIARLSSLSPTTIDQLYPFDWKQVAWGVASFFVLPPSSTQET